MLLIKPGNVISFIISLIFFFGFASVLQAQPDNRYTIAGVVTDRAGNPLAGATVSLRTLSDNNQQGMMTDISGNFKFEKLQPGMYIVSATYLGTGGFLSDTLLLDSKLNRYTLLLNIALNEEAAAVFS